MSLVSNTFAENERVRPLKRVEYDQLVELGAFEGERVELLRGVIVEMSPQGTAHSRCLVLLSHALFAACADTHWVRVQMPLATSEDSEPEPDIALVRREVPFDEHPATADLVIEVAESSVRRDRDVKASLYAEAGVPEYWVVNLISNVVEVHTSPVDGVYSQITIARPGDVVPLVAVSGVSLDPGSFLV